MDHILYDIGAGSVVGLVAGLVILGCSYEDEFDRIAVCSAFTSAGSLGGAIIAAFHYVF